jgi:hypothetical protein
VEVGRKQKMFFQAEKRRRKQIEKKNAKKGGSLPFFSCFRIWDEALFGPCSLHVPLALHVLAMLSSPPFLRSFVRLKFERLQSSVRFKLGRPRSFVQLKLGSSTGPSPLHVPLVLHVFATLTSPLTSRSFVQLKLGRWRSSVRLKLRRS